MAGIALGGFAAASAALSGVGIVVVGVVQLLLMTIFGGALLTGSSSLLSSLTDWLGLPAGIVAQLWVLSGAFAMGGAPLLAGSAATVRWSAVGTVVAGAGAVGVALALCVFAVVLLGLAPAQSGLLAIALPNFTLAAHGVLPVIALQLLLLGVAALFAKPRAVERRQPAPGPSEYPAPRYVG